MTNESPYLSVLLIRWRRIGCSAKYTAAGYIAAEWTVGACGGGSKN